MATNNILPFCPTDSGTNLLTQVAYAAAADRTSGNQPGVASSKLVNKALRQSAFIASQLAQYISDKTGSDVIDDGNTATLLAIMNAAFAAPTTSYQIANVSVAGAVAASALTLNLKDSAGNTPSSTSICSIGFRSATATSGVYNQRTVTGALSLVVPSGATLGMASAVASYFYVYAIDTGSGVVLGVSSAILDEGSVQSAVAIGAGSTSATVLYATANQTNKPIRMIARILTTQATAGAWVSALTEISPTPFVKNAFPAIRSVTTTDSCTNADQTLVFSGASFSETIFDATANKGKILTFMHQGTSLTNVYTLLTPGQTINGVASGSYALYTFGESLTIQSLGTTDWKVIDHKVSTDWSATTAITIGAVTTAPTKSSTKVTDTVKWKRNGDGRTATIRYDYYQSAGTGGAIGSGDYLFTIPLTVDTAVIPAYNGVLTSQIDASAHQSVVPGFGHGVYGGSNYCEPWSFILFSSTQFRSHAAFTYSSIATFSSAQAFFTSSGGLYFEIIVPVLGWQP